MGFSLGSLFGGGSVDHTYANKRDGALSQLGDLRGLFRSLGGGADETLQSTAPAFKQQLGNVTDILSSDPYTDSYRAAKVSEATAGTDAAYQAAKARLTGDLASRGLGQSGAMAGGMAQLEAARAGALSSAGNDVAMQALQDRERRARDLFGITSGVRDNAFQQRAGALGAEAGIDNNMAGAYGDAYGQEMQHADNRFAGTMALLGGLGSAAGGALGGGLFSKAAKTAVKPA